MAVNGYDPQLDPTALARLIIDFDPQPGGVGPARAAPRGAAFAFPQGLEPTPTALPQAPAPDAPLPHADYVVITWTAAELRALAAVLTPGVSPDIPTHASPKPHWYAYAHRFDADYRPQIRSGAPSLSAKPHPRLGSYYLTTIGNKRVLCMKSELHLNQDGISEKDVHGNPTGKATLPVADLFKQVIAEAKPKLVITTGTAGATYESHQLGDVVVTRAAKFLLSDEFKNEPYNGKVYTCDFQVPTAHLADAETIMRAHVGELAEPPLGPPTKLYEWPVDGLIPGPKHTSDIKLDGRDFKKFHPILTTDSFDIGTSGPPHLNEQGCAVEMGDAALGLVCEQLGAAAPRWLVVRNASDPQINGDLLESIQKLWAVWYYTQYGYWTSINSALACWAVVAGD